MLNQYNLGTEAISYIIDSLSVGDILARRLLELPLETGLATVKLPNGVDPQRLKAYETGGICKKAEPLDALIEVTIEYLSTPGYPVAVFETLARVGDRGLSSHDIPYFSHGKHVFYFAAGQNIRYDKVRLVIRNARNYSFVGLLSKWTSTGMDIARGQQVTDEFIQELVKGCEFIFIGAYDNEATIVWRRPK